MYYMHIIGRCTSHSLDNDVRFCTLRLLCSESLCNHNVSADTVWTHDYLCTDDHATLFVGCWSWIQNLRVLCLQCMCTTTMCLLVHPEYIEMRTYSLLVYKQPQLP